ncbi:FecR domain-containing protein [Uliginosibacterium sp. TH139]|uniref:FecR domain-containing protein n=1 Tax=Uliginosibacterium sp. TH139 TaxID=2067453 RepID=UPI000C7A5DA8|nr:FecR domain-containing protein [Uliginosibacterium sp. TH139]PLK49659.1 iron dicitrate transport regulator FecR [Uliginosibacterium sp. TH139]
MPKTPEPRTPMNAPAAPDATALSPAIIAKAAEWMARLWSEDARAEDKAACGQWRAAHPDHERAWQELQIFEDKLDGLPSELAHHVLREPADQAWQKRTTLRRLFGLAIVAGGAASLLRSTDTWQRGTADYATATGEIREIQLADGTSIVLATATRIDVRFDAQERRIVLHAGEILITTAPDPASVHRPFRVHGRHGRIEALGTRFSVRQDENASQVAVFEGAVELRSRRRPDLAIRISAGEGSHYSATRIAPLTPVQESAAAWRNGVLLAENMRVADFVAELARYRPGLLRCDPAVAELRVSGVFSLRDTDRALQNLALALPLVPVYRTRYWVTLQAS